MSSLFLRLVNLSITASWLILAIIIIRPLMKKVPKWIGCGLWALVAIRLICPFSIQSALSLVPRTEPIMHDMLGVKSVEQLGIQNGIVANKVGLAAVNAEGSAGVSLLQLVVPALTIIWLVGMVSLLVYAVVSCIKLRKAVGPSVYVGKNILACDEVKSPFVLGIFHPIIYVPSTMSGKTLDYVVSHENAHIARRDYLWKPLGYLILTIYWFNPLCWIAYILLCRDIEMACDEKVISNMDRNGKADYSQALLDCNFSRRRIVACPVAFGEVGVKSRVKSVLNYKKPALWILAVAILVCGVVGVCFMTNPKEAYGESGNQATAEETKGAAEQEIADKEQRIVDLLEKTESDMYYVSEGADVEVDEQQNMKEKCEILKTKCGEVIARCKWSDEDVKELVEYIDEYQDGDVNRAIEMINSTPADKVVAVVHNLSGLYWPLCVSDTWEDMTDTVESVYEVAEHDEEHHDNHHKDQHHK